MYILYYDKQYNNHVCFIIENIGGKVWTLETCTTLSRFTENSSGLTPTNERTCVQLFVN